MKSMKKSIFKASFEESLNLLDDGVSGKFARDNYQDALKKEQFRGTKKSYVWLVILTFLFIIGPNWLIVALNDYLFYHSDPRDLTVPLPDINFLPYWVFWIALAIWLLLIILGKRYNQQFILIYRGQFHFMVTFIIWLFVELNLFSLNLIYAVAGFWGMFTFVGLILLIIISKNSGLIFSFILSNSTKISIYLSYNSLLSFSKLSKIKLLNFFNVLSMSSSSDFSFCLIISKK